jgi:hypothetical protein
MRQCLSSILVLVVPHTESTRTSSDGLITHEESGQVVIRMERIHNLGKCIALRRVPLWRRLVDLRIKRIKIHPGIDTGISKRLHAGIVVGGGVNMVDADRVHANGLHERSVEGALRCGHERISRDKLVGDAC